MRTSNDVPLANRFGLVHVTVATLAGGSAAMVQIAGRAPYPILTGQSFDQAVDQARAFAATDPMFMLELPPGHEPGEADDLVHVDRWPTGVINVVHEAADGGATAILKSFPPERHRNAIEFALSCSIALGARLGCLAVASACPSHTCAGLEGRP